MKKVKTIEINDENSKAIMRADCKNHNFYLDACNGSRGDRGWEEEMTVEDARRLAIMFGQIYVYNRKFDTLRCYYVAE